MRLDFSIAAEDFEETDTEDGAGGARDGDDETCHSRNRRRRTSSRVFW